MNSKIEIRYVRHADEEFWFSLDKHLPADEFPKKIRDKQGYVLFADERPTGILRYNFFWDNTPFCTLLYIAGNKQGQGYGRILMNHWENEMRSLGHGLLFVSTRSDESAQHFYRKLGYSDCGNLNIPDQPTELFFRKKL